MTTRTVATWPRIQAVTREDGTGEIIINGTSRPIETTHAEAARAAIVAVIAETATKVNRPVRVTATGPEGTWPLIVHPDGTVEADEDAEAAPQRRSRRRQATPVDDPATAPASPPPAAPQTQNPASTGSSAPWVREAPEATRPTTRRELRQSFLAGGTGPTGSGARTA